MLAGAALPDLDKPVKLWFGRSPFPAAFDRFHMGIQDEAAHRFYVELLAAAALASAALIALRDPALPPPIQVAGTAGRPGWPGRRG